MAPSFFLSEPVFSPETVVGYLTMTSKALQLLIAERDKLNRAIEILTSEVKRRGRPPGRKTGGGKRSRRRRGRSSEARLAQSLRMTAYWAKKRREKGKGAAA